jgi:hypothetical protein
MRLSLNKRLLSLLTLLFFAAGISYQHLCAADLISCEPCETETHQSQEESGGCKTCQQSADLAKGLQPSKTADASLSLIYLAVAITHYIVFTPPEGQLRSAEPLPPEVPPARILRDIKRSTPIRGPSIVA